MAKSESSSVARIFQYIPELKLLKEFNLVGLLQKQSNHQKWFDDKTILAIGSQKLRFLVTPEADQFLEVMKIFEITEQHDFSLKQEIRTEEIFVTIGAERFSLFELLCICKYKLKCNFQF